MNQPDVSIIVPVYNVEQYLPECLESLIHQTMNNIQIICINDGSTDRSNQILKDYARKDCRIEIINQKNQGVSMARNRALNYVRGKYLMYLDSDDWIDSDTCQTVFDTAENRNTDLVLWSYIREFKGGGLRKGIFDENEIVFARPEVETQLYRRMYGPYRDELRRPEDMDALVTVWGKLYKSSLIIENKIQFVDLCVIGTEEDMLFNLFVLEHVKSAVYINKYFYHYRKYNEVSITSKYKEKLSNQWACLFNIIEQKLIGNKLGDSYKEALNNRICISILGLGLNLLSSGMSFWKINKEIEKILDNPRYRAAYEELRLSYFPLHWKIFYGFAKYDYPFGIQLMLYCIRKMIGTH